MGFFNQNPVFIQYDFLKKTVYVLCVHVRLYLVCTYCKSHKRVNTQLLASIRSANSSLLHL